MRVGLALPGGPSAAAGNGRIRANRLLWALPFGVYLVWDALVVVHYINIGGIPGYDGWLYREAAAAWLAGGDPWSVGTAHAHFAGAPPTLLAFAPTVLVPAQISRFFFVLGAAVLAVWSLRRIGLPVWWLAYTPMFTAIWLGQPGILVFALLLTRWAWAACLVKPYAGIPLIVGARWRQVALACLAGVATLLIAPWREWIAVLPYLSARLSAELHADDLVAVRLAIGLPSLAIVLWLRRDEAPWLAIPAVWPLAEYHYAIFALPTRRPLLLLAMAFLPGPVPVALYAVWLVAMRLRRDRGPATRGVPDALDLGAATPGD